VSTKLKVRRGKAHLIGAGRIGGPAYKLGASDNFWNKKLPDSQPIITSGGYAAKVALQARATALNGNGYYNPPYNNTVSTFNYSVPLWTVPSGYPTRTVYFAGQYRDDCKRGTGALTSGSPIVTGTSTAWTNGDRIYSPYFPDGTTVVSGGGTTTLTLSANASATGPADLWFVQPSSWIAGLQTACLQVPVPRLADMPSWWSGNLWAGGTDQEIAIYDPAAKKMFEFWKFQGNETSGYQASYGGVITDVDTNDGTLPNTWGAKAVSLMAIGGCIMLQELRDGIIKHGLNLALPVTAPFHLAPATRHDSMNLLKNPGADGTSGWAVPEGARFRLLPNVFIDPNWPPFVQMAAIAARDYGVTITDTAGVVQWQTEDPRTAGTMFSRAPDTSPLVLGDMNYFPYESLVQIAFP
jgi:hypothetical protein